MERVSYKSENSTLHSTYLLAKLIAAVDGEAAGKAAALMRLFNEGHALVEEGQCCVLQARRVLVIVETSIGAVHDRIVEVVLHANPAVVRRGVREKGVDAALDESHVHIVALHEMHGEEIIIETLRYGHTGVLRNQVYCARRVHDTRQEERFDDRE